MVKDVHALMCLFVFFCATSLKAEDPRAKLRNFAFPHGQNSLIISLKPQFAAAQVDALLAKYGGKLTHQFKSSPAVLAEFSAFEGQTIEGIAQQVAANEAVNFIEANTILRTHGVMPNDPKFGELYGLHNTGQSNGAADADIDAPEAWEISTGSHDVLVAVIDTGINHKHPDLQGNLWQNPGEIGLDAQGRDKRTNGVDDDNNGYIDDFRGWDFVGNDNDPMDDNGYHHGTHCAGTIGAKGNDNFGVVGVNWHVSLVGVKFLSAAGTGELAAAIKSIEYANLIGAHIQSNSWGGGGHSDTMFAAIKVAERKGTLFVAAAGNESSNTDDSPHYPSSYEASNVISVGATDRQDFLAAFSNFGLKSVDIAAPGVDILSLAGQSDFRVLSGTSMATPHVAGVAALIKAHYPLSNHLDLIKRIMNGADRVSYLKELIRLSGRLNAANALEEDSVAPGAVMRIRTVKVGKQDLELEWGPAGDDGDVGLARHYELRVSEKPIRSESDWEAAFRPTTTYQGSAEEPKALVEGLPFNFTGYVSIRAIDNVGNQSAVGHSEPVAVTRVKQIFAHKADHMDGVTVEGTWGVETLADVGRTVFSDSPGLWYANDLDVSIKLPEIVIPQTSTGLALSFSTRTELEKGYDFGLVEFSVDGGHNWQEVQRITGSKPWHSRLVDLGNYLRPNDRVVFRFRMTSDYVIQGDGWFIDDLMLISDL